MKMVLSCCLVALCLCCLAGCERIEDEVRNVDWNKAVNDTIDSGKRVAGRVDWEKHLDAIEGLAEDVVDAVRPEFQK